MSVTENRVTRYLSRDGKSTLSTISPWLTGWILEQNGEVLYFSDPLDAHYNAEKAS